MGVPAFLNSTFRYKETLAVTDVQTIINDMVAECVTNGGWTTTLGGSGSTPTTIQSPARSDGAFFTINMTRISATRIAYIIKDHLGLLINNATDTRQDVDAGGTTIHYYTGPFHACIVSERATPEAFACGIFDQSPESLSVPRPNYFATQGPRNNAGSLAAQQWDQVWLLNVGAVAYATASTGIRRNSGGGTPALLSLSGALLFYPVEFGSSTGHLMGRYFQCLMLDAGQAFAAEFTVPLDTGVTGVFKVAGFTTNNTGRIAFRKS